MRIEYILKIGILFVFTIFISCNQISEHEKEFNDRMRDVIKLHDELMPKMGEISELIQKLEKVKDTLDGGTENQDTQNNLKESYDHMMRWMSDFTDKFPYEEKDKKYDSEEITEKLNILKEKHNEVRKMKEKMNSSINKAKNIIGE